MKSATIQYKHGNTTLSSYLAYDDSVSGPRPAIIVFPEWWGLNEYIKSRTRQLAELGYVAMAADLFGDGKVVTAVPEAAALAGALREDRPTLRARAAAGLAALRSQKSVDPSRVAAIGYCFGGTTALELGRGGADLRAVVSFHGGLDTPNPADAKQMKAKVLVCTGADDAWVPPEQINAFIQEMRDGHVDYLVDIYGGAVHAYSNPDADKLKIPNIGYNARADHRSWSAMKEFFAETLLGK